MENRNGEVQNMNTFMENLGKDEEVVTQAKIHWASCIAPGVLALFFLIVGLGSDGGFGIFLVFAMLIMAKPVTAMLTTQLILTNKRIYGKVGLIRTRTMDVPLNKLNTVSVSNGFFGKVFGYGKLHITCASGEYNYDQIQNPGVFRSVLMEEIDRYDEARIKKQAAEMAAAIRQ